MNKIVQQLRENVPKLEYLLESEIFVMPAHTRTIFFDKYPSIEKSVVMLPKLVFVNHAIDCPNGEYVFALNENDTVCYPPFPNILNNLKICVTMGGKTAQKTAINFFNSCFTRSGVASLNVYGDHYGVFPLQLFVDLNSGKLKLKPLTLELNRRFFILSHLI